VQGAAGAPVPIRLSRPVAAVRLGRRRAVPSGTRPATALWHVTPRRPAFGVVETRAVYVRPRPWEAWTLAGRLTWVTPAPLAVSVTGATARTVTIQFSRPVTAPRIATWHLTPAVPGRWIALSSDRFRFVADTAVAWWPGTTVTVTLPGGPAGPLGVGGIWLTTATTVSWTLPDGSLLRAQQLLAELGYLPLTWARSGPPLPATPAAQWQAIYQPPAGTFHWRWTPMPAPLAALFRPGVDTVMLRGAVMQFEHDHGLAVDGVVGPEVWQALVAAAEARQVNPSGYSWVYVSETLPELLTLWHNGRIVLTSLANTGIPASPTALGTYPVYLRYRSQTMRGINPNGTPYVDPGVPYVNYFDGGDAVHGFVRAAYGFPQSLGCVELPPPVAGAVWPYLHYGTLVTVDPPGSPRRLAA
jgi:peptidoglycan hydrolase-like protein with peptidoglycan-binding domain